MVVQDFIETHPNIDQIFVATDEQAFIELIKIFAVERKINLLFHDHSRSGDGNEIYLTHDPVINKIISYETIRDCYTLSKCRYLLANYSALSAWAKVINPDLESYRTAACYIGCQHYWKETAFPHGFATLYKSDNPEVQKLLKRLQMYDWTLRGEEFGTWVE